MRKWIISGSILFALVVVVFVALLNITTLIERNKDFLVGRVEDAVGRKIAVDKVEATLISGIGIRLANFAMADDPAYASGDFVRAADLQITLKFWPLLKKEFQINRLILHSPVIHIVRNQEGSFNFSTIGKAKEKMAADDKKERTPKEAGETAFLLSLVEISRGEFRYQDRRDGTDLQVRQIDLKVEDLNFTQPGSVKLAAAVYAERQNFQLRGQFGPLPAGGDFSQLAVNGVINIDPLDIGRVKAALPKLLNALPGGLALSGLYRVKDLQVMGTVNDLTVKGVIDGTDGTLNYGTSVQKPAGIPLTVTSDARVAPNKVVISEGRVKLYNLELTTAGEISFGDGAVVNLSVKSNAASLTGWEKIIPTMASYQLAGTVETQAKVRGKVGQGAAPQIDGVLSLKNASAKPPAFPRPIENLDTKISFTGNRADIDDMTLNLGKSRIRLAAAVDRFSPLTLSYKLSTPELWPADYHKSLGEARKADVIRNLRSDGQFTMNSSNLTYQGKIMSADGTLYNVAYKALDASLAVVDKTVNIRSLRADALGGRVQMQGDYSFKEPLPRFTVTSKIQGIDVKQLYSALDVEAEHDIRGRMNSEVKLSGQGKNWQEIKPTLQGQGETEVVQGALLNFNLAEGTLSGITGIPGLTQIINPSVRKKYPETFSAKDTEFKELKMIFDLADGRMNVKTLRMSAAEFLTQGSGWADTDRRIDFRSTVSFSQALSADLSQSARELRYLFNNQGQLEVPIALTGKLPNVKPRPDTRYLAQIVQRGFLRKGTDELQNRIFGGKETEDKTGMSEDAKQRKRNSTEELIKRGLENLFKRR